MFTDAIELGLSALLLVIFLIALKKKWQVMMLVAAFSLVTLGGCRYQSEDSPNVKTEQPKYNKTNCGCL